MMMMMLTVRNTICTIIITFRETCSHLRILRVICNSALLDILTVQLNAWELDNIHLLNDTGFYTSEWRLGRSCELIIWV